MAYQTPVRRIRSPMDMGQWMRCPGHVEYIQFLMKLSESVRGKENSSAVSFEVLDKICCNLKALSAFVDDIPAIEQPQRFGNAAYRTWFDKMENSSNSMSESLLPDNLKSASVEIAAYWCDSFGNKSRIDYGTGHEMNFLIFLLCLEKLEAFHNSSEVYASLVNVVFVEYMRLVRKLQLTYRMEPAGSHGVYSLDDYQFLPFYFGSSQLSGADLEPKDIPESEKMSENKDRYLFCAAIDYINQVKTGPFSEHSNQLWNISAVPHWKKVNEGLMKMYKAEVLSKFPIVQHVLFGSLFKFE